VENRNQFTINQEIAMKITKVSFFTKKPNTLDLPISEEKYNDYCERRASGRAGLIQDEFPELTADQREFILTGTTKEEWDAVFGDDE
jgi:hypothetical protein